MEYLVLRDIHLDALVITVNEYIKKGWKPLGGINSYRDKFMGGNHEVAYLQGLVK
ncbi:hypothetical protein ITJ86_04175 [Winogradskyella sp. F6397]|uniref:DUF1737 domain-containing protein n=1 Tax=Winogradskyella marina TaxID=2785530 RepID=A0ABS0EF50_9FLAO|nr:hypothetical protein [Winogradskyella marina]MBF8149078.1 hypothetical protein [Winogradskyella marina]